AVNRTFYDHIGRDESPWPDWALTVLFYAAVHEIQALFADNRGTIIGYGLRWPVKGHTERLAAPSAHAPWRPLEAHYGHLYGWSRKTRYDCDRPDAARLRKAENVLQRISDTIAEL